MTYGISTDIVNSNNEIVVDQNFACLEVFQEGTITWPGGDWTTLQEITYPGLVYPMVFIKLPFDTRFFFGPTTPTKFWFSCNAATGTSIEYKVCGVRTDNVTMPEGYGGLIKRKNTDEIAWTSKRRYIRITDAIQVSYADGINVLRDGDDIDWSYAGGGEPTGVYLYHPTLPIAANTFWHARQTGLYPRPGSVNSNVWALERVNTTHYRFLVDGPLPREHRLTMGLPENTGVQHMIPFLVGY